MLLALHRLIGALVIQAPSGFKIQLDSGPKSVFEELF